jgi:hypothetical protein
MKEEARDQKHRNRRDRVLCKLGIRADVVPVERRARFELARGPGGRTGIKSLDALDLL